MSSSSSLTTTTPPPPPSSIPEAYTTLLTHLTHLTLSPPIVQEIEILPATFSPTILSSGPCIGIPKPILISAFLHARQILLSHITRTPLYYENNIQAPKRPGDRDVTENEQGENEQGVASQTEALDATLVILLIDAGYTSAINLRKRWLISLRDGTDAGDSQKQQELQEAIHKEMIWLETLVTSPLFRHAKSSALWAHRWWVVRTFLTSPSSVGEFLDSVREGEAGNRRGEERWWAFVGKELEIVMKAAERHPGNYHAWNYARNVIRLFLFIGIEDGEEEMANETIVAAWKLWVEMVHRWCLGHPRDISGWTFLSFLLGQYMRSTELGENGKVVDVFRKTQEFQKQLNWQGESVEWFLRFASTLGIDLDNG